MNKQLTSFLLATVAVFSVHAAAPAPVAASGGWVRPAGPGQKMSAAYVTLTATESLTLLGADSAAAGVVEIHEMRMEGDVMKMRSADSLPLAAGKAVELKPGGWHLMLMELKGPIRVGTQVPFTLRFRDAAGRQRTLPLNLPVSTAAPASPR